MKRLLQNGWMLKVVLLPVFCFQLSIFNSIAQEQPSYQWYCNGQVVAGMMGEDIDRTETVAGVYSYYRVTTYGGKSLVGATVVVEVEGLVPPSAELSPGVQWTTENLNDASKGGVDGAPYGRFYSYEEALKACPSGWRLPTNAEVIALADLYGGIYAAGTAFKSTAGWQDNINGTNASGLNLLPGGFGDGSYRGQFALLWTSEGAWNVYQGTNMEFLPVEATLRSVRCVK